MIKVSDVVIDLLQSDEVALEAFRAGLLNLSAYADKIHKQVEKATFKEIKKGTIVVSLSRVGNTALKKTSPLKPDVKIVNLSVKSPLSALTFHKTADVQRRLSTLNPFLVSPSDLFSVTEGASEISLICTHKVKEFIINHMGEKPKKETENLVAVTVQFPEIYNKTPNVLHVLLSRLAVKRINVVELVSTFTETSFIVEKADMETVITTFNTYT